MTTGYWLVRSIRTVPTPADSGLHTDKTKTVMGLCLLVYTLGCLNCAALYAVAKKTCWQSLLRTCGDSNDTGYSVTHPDLAQIRAARQTVKSHIHSSHDNCADHRANHA